MQNIRIDYLYRDASNYKAYPPPLIVAGPATDAQIAQLMATLEGDGLFIAEQVGLPAAEFDVAPFGDYADDHPYHEMMAVERTDEAPTTDTTFGELLARFEAVAEWDPSLGRQVDDGLGI